MYIPVILFVSFIHISIYLSFTNFFPFPFLYSSCRYYLFRSIIPFFFLSVLSSLFVDNYFFCNLSIFSLHHLIIFFCQSITYSFYVIKLFLSSYSYLYFSPILAILLCPSLTFLQFLFSHLCLFSCSSPITISLLIFSIYLSLSSYSLDIFSLPIPLSLQSCSFSTYVLCLFLPIPFINIFLFFAPPPILRKNEKEWDPGIDRPTK